MTSIKAKEAMNKKNKEMQLSDLPALGPASVKALNDAGITTYFQLFVKFATFNDEAKFTEWAKVTLPNATDTNIQDLIAVLNHKKRGFDNL